MQVNGSKILILGGYGLVGSAIAHELMKHNPKQIIISSLKQSEAESACEEFRKEYPEAKIKAFEADPKIFAVLKENLSKNGIEKLELFNKAVWINDEGVEFGIEGADGSSVFSKENTVRVESVRLKKLLSEENEIDLLKMDIEGAEANVIPDCANELSKVKNLFLEYHTFVGRKQNLAEVLLILEKSGFRYFIKQEADRKIPFVNRKNKNNPQMDLQLNIYAYREE